MRVIKKINNNFALATDSSGELVIVYGKGLGYAKIPYDIEDLKLVDRVFYNVDSRYINLFNEVAEEIFQVGASALDLIKSRIDDELNPNLLFTLVDHINFAIQRVRNNLTFEYPLIYDVENLYGDEFKVAKEIIALVEFRLNAKLPYGESSAITLHIINARLNGHHSSDQINVSAIIEEITSICNRVFTIEIDQTSFNYSRFATHIQYMLKRGKTNEFVSKNEKLYISMKEEFPETYLCVQEISFVFEQRFDWTLNHDEQLYLMLHVNRMKERENLIDEREKV